MKRTGLPRQDRPLSGPEHYWAMMRARTASAGFFTIGDIHLCTNGVRRETVQHYVRGCLATGAVEEVAPEPAGGSHAPKRYRVKVTATEAPTEGKGLAPSGATRARGHLWTAIRTLDFFTSRDLAIASSTDDVQVSRRSAQAYITALSRAGYLIEVSGSGGGRCASLRLKPGMNTGPKAPVVRTDGSVVDRNKGLVVGSALEARS